MRVYNLREGLTAADDTLPSRFFDESLRMSGKRWEGTRLKRERFAAATFDLLSIPTHITTLGHRHTTTQNSTSGCSSTC